MNHIQVFLMLGFENDTPIHMVIAINEITGDCYVITVYFPNSDIWQAGFEKRRESWNALEQVLSWADDAVKKGAEVEILRYAAWFEVSSNLPKGHDSFSSVKSTEENVRVSLRPSAAN